MVADDDRDVNLLDPTFPLTDYTVYLDPYQVEIDPMMILSQTLEKYNKHS